MVDGTGGNERASSFEEGLLPSSSMFLVPCLGEMALLPYCDIHEVVGNAVVDDLAPCLDRSLASLSLIHDYDHSTPPRWARSRSLLGAQAIAPNRMHQNLDSGSGSGQGPLCLPASRRSFYGKTPGASRMLRPPSRLDEAKAVFMERRGALLETVDCEATRKSCRQKSRNY
ncbi:hypothetical protein PCANC_28383 [Puccinia coronata f. sp. avenae]|uniref:Uncharacterized protein n=1 Tax=Puccinia coronata f. sp. avenae TaxID=200324 RepID=A0A2N5RVS1_9BASI|nr:hypothetical protein PCANC_28383 [Puccinia coronata f. sp. avenae]PLW51936.1 hypothetical protein PCASD_00917 [Puccinia coronata f. sp. avenae]